MLQWHVESELVGVALRRCAVGKRLWDSAHGDRPLRQLRNRGSTRQYVNPVISSIIRLATVVSQDYVNADVDEFGRR